MQIISLNEQHPYVEWYYDWLDNIFYYLAQYLPPKIFHNQVECDGEILYLPKLISKRYFNSLDADVQDFMNELNKQIR